jgi:hypothetical protein
MESCNYDSLSYTASAGQGYVRSPTAALMRSSPDSTNSPPRRAEQKKDGEMHKSRCLSAGLALVAATVLVVPALATASHGHPRPDNIYIGTSGHDSFEADPGQHDLIFGRAGDDTLAGGDLADVILGNRGDDILYGGPGVDLLRGGPGADGIRGGDQHDRIHGGAGPDRISGGGGHDLIRAGRGDDFVYAADGQRDRVYCGLGYDTVVADHVDDVAPDCEHVTRV